MPSCPSSFVGGGSPPALHTPSKVYVEGLEYISSGLIQQVRNHTLILRASEQLPELLHRDAVVDCRCHESCRFAASVFIVFLPFLPLPCVHDKCVCVTDHSGRRPAPPTARTRSRPLKKPGDDENWQFYFFTVIRRRFIVWVLIVGLLCDMSLTTRNELNVLVLGSGGRGESTGSCKLAKSFLQERRNAPGCRDEEAHVLVRWSQSHCRSLHPRLCCEGPSHLAHARGIGACTLAVADVLAI